MKKNLFRPWMVITFFCLYSLFCSVQSDAEASITMAWDPPAVNEDGTPCSDLAGYKVYYDTDGSGAPYDGTGLPQGGSPITIPNWSLEDPENPEIVVSGLTEGDTYYIVLTAYDLSGNESRSSNEIKVVGTDPNPDFDHDGLPDAWEATYGLDTASSDSDGDGLSDLKEWGTTDIPLDTDLDGSIDAVDTDSDDDGASDSDELDADADGDGIPDRIDNKAATMKTKRGKMSLSANHLKARIIRAKVVPNITGGGQPGVDFPYEGVEYRIRGIDAGESVLVTLRVSSVLPANAEYWKYDENKGFERIESQVNGREISFLVTDGAVGDADGVANREIVDPGFVGIPEASSVSDTPTDVSAPVSSGGGGGSSGCALSRGPGNVLDLTGLMLPLLLIMCLRRMGCNRMK